MIAEPRNDVEGDIVARRVISLLSHAGFLLEGAKAPFYESVMKT